MNLIGCWNTIIAFSFVKYKALGRVKTPSKISLFLRPSSNDSWMCSCILFSWENRIPLNKLFTPGGRLFNQPKGKHVPKRVESHRCEVNALEILACNFSTFFKVSQRDSL